MSIWERQVCIEEHQQEREEWVKERHLVACHTLHAHMSQLPRADDMYKWWHGVTRGRTSKGVPAGWRGRGKGRLG